MSINHRLAALKNFLHQDDEAVPIHEPSFNFSTVINLKPTSAIIIIGYVKNKCKSFWINLGCESTGNIAFYLNPRLDRGYVVRNSFIKGRWGREENCSSTKFNIQRQTYFHIIIFCGPNEFQISINGEHFCSFTYRIPLDLITNFDYEGDIEDVRARVTELCIYPDPKIIKNYRNIQLTDKKPLLDNLNVPININIFQNFKPGATIFIRGRLKLLPNLFSVNLQKSQLIFPTPDIGLHFNPRFRYENRPACIVINTFINGFWGCEERYNKNLPWCPGREFLLTFRCEYDKYLMWLDDTLISEFQHRMDPSIIDTLHITGDYVIHQVSLAFYD